MPRKLSRPEEKKTNEVKRSNNWNFILYPESAPLNWIDIINETRIEWVASPIHDKDKNPDDTEKKSHYHITLLFPSLKSYDQVKALTDSLNAPIPVRCQSVKGSIRYMVHKDNPEKYQYDWNDIKCYGGADLNALCAATATERMQIQKDILAYIRKAGIIEFEHIVNYACDEGLDEWVNVLLNFSTISITSYLRSRRHQVEHGNVVRNMVVREIDVNKETGEVMFLGTSEKPIK
jgi:hypothetical protein